MTDQELKDLVASLALESNKNTEQFKEITKQFEITAKQFREIAEQSKKTDEQFRKTDEKFSKTDEKFRKTDEQFRKTDEQFRKTDEQFRKTDEQFRKSNEKSRKIDERLDKQFKKYGGFIENDGKVVEEYFFSGLDETNKLHGEKYDHFTQEAKFYLKKGKEREFDIIGYNGNKITALEVKKVVHKNDVEKLVEKQLPFLKEFMKKSKEYDKHKIYGGIAGFKINKDAEEYAREKGLIILTKIGNEIKELTKDCEVKELK